MAIVLDDNTMGKFAYSAGAAGLALSTVGAFYSAEQQRHNLGFQADIAETNARMSESSAQQEFRRGDSEVGRLTMQYGQKKSSQRASMAARGVDLSVGSAAEEQASTDILKELDANTLKANAVRSAWGYRTQGVNYQNQANVARASASAINPAMLAGASLLSGATTLAKPWYRGDLKPVAPQSGSSLYDYTTGSQTKFSWGSTTGR